jgi:hypothetical protein
MLCLGRQKASRQAKGIGQLVFFKDSEEVSQSSPISYDVPHYGVTVSVDV